MSVPNMKKLLAITALALVATAALAQRGTVRSHTRPQPPSRDTLDRLNLTLAWSAKVPVDGLRDGFFSLQLIPGPKFTLLLAQTFQGSVVALNAETGDTLWRTTVGLPYHSMQPAGFNQQTIFACRRETLYALDRDDGKQMLYTVEPDSNQPVYGMTLEATPSAGLVADDEFLFVCFSNRIVRFAVPNFRAAFKLQARVPEPGGKLAESPQVIRTWNFNTYGSLLQAPIVERERLVATSADGRLFVLNKYRQSEDDPVSTFKTGGDIVAQVAFNKTMVYIPCEDSFLYALDSAKGRLMWRFASQLPLVHQPEATDADVFVTAGKLGMHRLDRASGDPKWSNKDAVKFLASNHRFVYALDRPGRMLVLDYERGKELAKWDTRDWTVPVSNDVTDRIYLASHDGQIVCLHHRDNAKPLKVKTFEVMKPPPKDEKKGDKDKVEKGDKDKIDKEKAELQHQLPMRTPVWGTFLTCPEIRRHVENVPHQRFAAKSRMVI
jgi:outer membrane protein assembly factor BamB